MKKQRKKWSLKDKVTVAVCLSFSVGAMAVGMTFMVSNLRMSDPIFIQYPLLAILLSGIVPLIAMAIKFIGNFIEHGCNRKRYGKAIGLLAIISAAYWGWLYAQIYPGAAMIYEIVEHDLASAFVMMQLSTEILTAAALALVAEDIYIRYYPDSYGENPEDVAIERSINNILPQHEALGKMLSDVYGKIRVLEASRKAYINERRAEYICAYEKYISNQNSFKNT